MLNPRTLLNGCEQYEKFKSRSIKKSYVAYDYRHTNGELFSCIKLTLKQCRTAKNEWLKRRNFDFTIEKTVFPNDESDLERVYENSKWNISEQIAKQPPTSKDILETKCLFSDFEIAIEKIQHFPTLAQLINWRTQIIKQSLETV